MESEVKDPTTTTTEPMQATAQGDGQPEALEAPASEAAPVDEAPASESAAPVAPAE